VCCQILRRDRPEQFDGVDTPLTVGLYSTELCLLPQPFSIEHLYVAALPAA
jgi:hypothetical protein